jgi:hypothetical protein
VVLELLKVKSDEVHKDVKQKMMMVEGKMQDYMRNFFTSPVI